MYSNKLTQGRGGGVIRTTPHRFSKWLDAKDQALTCKQLWVSYLLSIKQSRTVAMATAISQHVRHIGRHLGFFENFILRKIPANFTEISRKHAFAASNRNIIKNRV